MVRTLQIIVLIAAALGLFRIRFGNDPSLFHRPDALMVSGERAVAEATGAAQARFRVVDLAEWQRENAELKRRMGVEPTGEFLSAEDLPREMTFVDHANGREMLLLPSDEGLDPRAELQKLFDRLARSTYPLLAVSFAILIVFLAAVYRRRFVAYVVPLAASVAATAGVLGWSGETVTFFHVLCFFVLCGLGVDYVVFHRAGGARRVVFASFLTSAVGFGLLGFTSFAVTRGMGLTLGIGLVFAYFFSLPASAGASDCGTAGGAWSRQDEKSAGRFRLWAMFFLYRLFGKTFAKAVSVFVVLCAWPFLGAARRSLRDFLKIADSPVTPFRVILNFAWSMLDKLDACSVGRDLPAMTVSGDCEWMKGGCFLLSTHVGCVEVLPALARAVKGPIPRVHAFQQLGHDAQYTSLFLRHLDTELFALHAVESIGVETAVEIEAAIRRGEIALMAGDRPSARDGRRADLEVAFLGRPCRFPRGVFRFAKLMNCPVYALACVRVGWNAYEVVTRRLGADLASDYVAFLESAARAHPEQWFNFFDFFDI